MTLTVLILTFIVALDQVIKWVVSHGMELYESVPVIHNFFHITYLHNYGAAFSLLQGKRWLFLIMTVIVVIAIAVGLFLLRGKISKFYNVSMGLFLGGALGNFIDRLVHGYVIDYLEFIFGSYSFPVFNLADMGVVIGATLTVFYLLFLEERMKKKKDGNDDGKRTQSGG